MSLAKHLNYYPSLHVNIWNDILLNFEKKNTFNKIWMCFAHYTTLNLFDKKKDLEKKLKLGWYGALYTTSAFLLQFSF